MPWRCTTLLFAYVMHPHQALLAPAMPCHAMPRWMCGGGGACATVAVESIISVGSSWRVQSCDLLLNNCSACTYTVAVQCTYTVAVDNMLHSQSPSDVILCVQCALTIQPRLEVMALSVAIPLLLAARALALAIWATSPAVRGG
jgi:hypothetical protein